MLTPVLAVSWPNGNVTACIRHADPVCAAENNAAKVGFPEYVHDSIGVIRHKPALAVLPAVLPVQPILKYGRLLRRSPS